MSSKKKPTYDPPRNYYQCMARCSTCDKLRIKFDASLVDHMHVYEVSTATVSVSRVSPSGKRIYDADGRQIPGDYHPTLLDAINSALREIESKLGWHLNAAVMESNCAREENQKRRAMLDKIKEVARG